MKNRGKFFGISLLLVAITLIVLCSGCTSNDNQAPTQTNSPSTDVTPASNEANSTPAMSDAENVSNFIVIYDDNESSYNGTLPTNDIALSGTLTPIVNASTVTGYVVNLHLKNNGAPFSFTCTKATFDNGQGSGVVSLQWSEGHTRTGHMGGSEQQFFVPYTTLMPNGVLDYNISTMNNDISELQQSSKLNLRIELCSGSSNNPSLLDPLCTFKAIIPRAKDVINTKEYPLTFSSVNANN